ncbi:hypothetical protein LC607_35565 [Nostoc sp. CHAB 5824]|nr:hypothetical protein [Nostoc sp. CHAB 5824]
MAIYGSSARWTGTFDRTLIPRILELILSAWQNFTHPTPDEIEIRITRRFRVHLMNAKKQEQLPFRIHREIFEDDLVTGKEKGRRVDYFTSWRNDNEDVYFAFECKRLNVIYNGEWRSQASDYVGKDGMMCFMEGKYASGLTDGGMLGYVMDGHTDKAIAAVSSQVKQHKADLQMATTDNLSPSLLLPNEHHAKETIHQLLDRSFTLHHIFLPI